MRLQWNKLCLVLGLCALPAHAVFVLPDVSNLAAFKAKLVEEAPWLATTSGSADAVTNGSAKVITNLNASELFKQLASERPEPVTIYVDRMTTKKEMVRAVKLNLVNQWKADVTRVLQQYPDPGILLVHTFQEADWVASHSIQALMVGLINSLPGPERGTYFKMGSPLEQLRELRANPNFTDDALKENFRAHAFGLDSEKISKDFLLGLADESLTREIELITLLRATWFQVFNGGKDQSSTAYDPFNLTHEQQNLFFDKITGALESNSTRRKKVTDYLEKLSAAQVNEENYELRQEDVQVVASTIKLIEVSPEVGASRGYLMGDCSTIAYGVAYSPYEYNYLVKDANNVNVAFIAATQVLANGIKTLFVHDFGGRTLPTGNTMPAIIGLTMAARELGYEQVTIGATNGNYGDWASTVGLLARNTQAANQVFPDADLREIIRRDTGLVSPYTYDMPENPHNRASRILVLNDELTKNIRVRIEGGGAGPGAIRSKPEALLRALEMYNADPEAGVTPAIRAIEGLQAGDISRIIEKLKNSEHLNIHSYYLNLNEIFAEYEINLSNHFIRDHNFLFWQGHLESSDAVATDDAAMLNRTIDFVILSLKRLPDPKVALRLLSEHKFVFEHNERFQAYLKSFTGHGAAEAPRLEDLMKLGFQFYYLSESPEAIQRFIRGSSAFVREHFVSRMTPAELAALPIEVVRLIAQDLGADDDEIPLSASKALMLTHNQNDANVMEELHKTIQEEEDKVIRARATILLIEMGRDKPKYVERLRRYFENMSPDIQVRIRPILEAHPVANQNVECEDILEDGGRAA